MFDIRAPMQDRRVLRRTWYLTESVCPELRCRWILEEDGASTGYNGTDEERNQSVTNACDTHTMASCA
ncbi:MAG: hypothetical protein WAN69_09495 [Candidatus Korobacteraceae bacterium]